MGGEINVEVAQDALGQPIVTDPHSGILLREELNGDLTIDTILNPDIDDAVNSVPVGGAIAAPASFWKGLNLSDALANILFPTLNPHYILPSCTLVGGSMPSLSEFGAPLAFDFNITGIENDGGIITNMKLYRNGTEIWSGAPTGYVTTDVPTEYGFVNPNNPNRQYNHIYSESFALINGSNIWQARISFNAGLAKQGNKGAYDLRAAALLNADAPQAAGNLYSNTYIAVAEYPIFWGVSNTLPTADTVKAAIEAGTANKSIVSAIDDISITFAATGQYLWFAYWSGYTTKTKWAVEGMNTGKIGGSTNLFGDYTQKFANSPLGYWTGLGLKIHISNYPTTTQGSMVLRNT